MATVVDAQTTIRGLNPLGAVSGGHVVLRGKICQMGLTCVPDRLKSSLWISAEFDYELRSVGSEKKQCSRWEFYPDSMLKASKGRDMNESVSRATKSQRYPHSMCK